MSMLLALRTETDSEMATPGDLVRVLAGALGVPEATLVVHDRNLLGAGLRSKKGRGRGAPSVTARDLAHLLTAILGSAQVKDSADTVRRYSNTHPHAPRSSAGLYGKLGIAELAALPRRHSFIDALEALIVAASAGSLARKLIEVAALNPGTSGDIRLAGTGRAASIHYATKQTRQPRAATDLEQYRRISETTILSAAELVMVSKGRK